MSSQNNRDFSILNLSRAIGDLRRRCPIAITDGENKIFILSAEIADEKCFSWLKSPALLLTKSRLEEKNDMKTQINDFAIINQYLYHQKPMQLEVANRVEQSALKLAKIAELLPAILLTDKIAIDIPILEVSVEDIENYSDDSSYQLYIAAEAPLTLKYAKNCRIIGFRSAFTAIEHYAIIIGNPKENPAVRIHSSCYTGDVLASLTCDCRDQLHDAISYMAENEGGIILYLMQEGRGIGLINKLRTYKLQYDGMDTVEANRHIGFDDDERRFLPAAIMLKLLGIEKVMVMTNNPIKANNLAECGIEVLGTISHIAEIHEHNARYMETKATKMGHILQRD